VCRAPVTPSVSVPLVAGNGAQLLAAKLDSLLPLDYPREQIHEIPLVSDGSGAARGVRLFEVRAPSTPVCRC
jgi:hypothetical protein